jgi:hypothetical protein
VAAVTAPYHITVRRKPETVVPGKRLGRHAVRDSRSAAYPFRAPRRIPLQTVLLQRHVTIFDQGDIGDCTGMAMAGALATGPVYDGLAPEKTRNIDERIAVALYSAATKLDSIPGTYLPDDTGSDGTSVAKAAQQAGLISGYTHAATVDDVLQALMRGPVIIGSDWYDSFDSPAPDGVVTITAGAQVRGGHEYLARGYDAAWKRIQLDNSWGTSYGVSGSFSYDVGTLEQLLAGDGDAVVPVPWTSPPPVPVPMPPGTAGADVRAWWAGVEEWAKARHTGSNRTAALASLDLARREGLIT